jgi:hypothetical protein
MRFPQIVDQPASSSSVWAAERFVGSSQMNRIVTQAEANSNKISTRLYCYIFVLMKLQDYKRHVVQYVVVSLQKVLKEF